MAGTPAAAAPCSLTGLDKFVWDGGGGADTRWSNRFNWDQNKVPGEGGAVTFANANDYACIPSGFTPHLDGGESADLAAVDSAGKLIINEGGKLFLHGDQNTRPSSLHDFDLIAATLGGEGKVVVSGTFTWRSLGTGAATQTTRRLEAIDSTRPATPGRTVIASTGRLNIDRKGVNFLDDRVIENLGTTTLSGNGYIAADYGTKFRNRRTTTDAQFIIKNDLGYFQGFSRSWSSTRSLFVNDGILKKDGGTGTSVIDAEYSEPSSGVHIIVVTGRVSVLSNTQSGAATVEPNGAFALGGCATAANSTCMSPAATGTDPRTDSVKLPSTLAAGREIDIAETAPPPGDPTLLHTANVATPRATGTSSPVVIVFTIDNTIVAGRAETGNINTDYPVSRNGNPVSVCTTPGVVSPAPACVVRSKVGGDLVVKLYTTQNGTPPGSATANAVTLRGPRYQIFGPRLR